MTASSTMEAKYVGFYEATRHAIWLWNFISDLGLADSIEKPIMMYCDNTAAVSFFNNLKVRKRKRKGLEIVILILLVMLKKKKVSRNSRDKFKRENVYNLSEISHGLNPCFEFLYDFNFKFICP